MMENFSNYLVLSSAILLLWYVTYCWFLARTGNHGWNRAFLLIGLLLSSIVPILPTNFTSEAVQSVLLAPVSVGVSEGLSAISSSITFNGFYAIVAILLLVRLGIATLKIFTSPVIGSYSFFNQINIESGLTPAQRKQVEAHETAHRALGHSFDVLLLELYKIIHWINPIAWMYSKSLKKVHEFQADQRVSQQGVDVKEYSMFLLSTAFQVPASDLVNKFHQPSILKQRIIMLTTKSNNRSKFLYLLSVPLMAFALILSSCTQESSTSSIPVQESDSNRAAVADSEAEFPGGVEAMYKWMGENLVYPKNLKEAGIEGKVFVKFVVTEDGSLDGFAIEKGLDPKLDKMTVQILTRMPKWFPAMKDGKPVKQEMVLPVSYKLE